MQSSYLIIVNGKEVAIFVKKGNMKHLLNSSFPSVYSETSSLTYTINKCSSEVCAVRLDFETFTTLGPADTIETGGGACQDSFVVRGTGSGLTTPVICGSNAGQHSKF